MHKNLSKKLLIILTIFVMFFINNISAKAAVTDSVGKSVTDQLGDTKCEWSVPSSYVDTKGNVIYDKNIWYKIQSNDGIKIYVDGIKIFDGKGAIKTTSSACPDYIMVSHGEGVLTGSMPAVEASQNEFNTYVVNQYETVPTSSLTTIGDGYKSISGDSSTMGIFTNSYVVLSSKKTTYSNNNLNMMKNAGFNDNQLKSAFGLEVAEKGYDKNFYDYSKVKWNNVITNDMKKIDKEKFYTTYRENNNASTILSHSGGGKNESVILSMKMKTFRNWFLTNARYLFEENLDKYKEAYTYAYLNTYPYDKIKENLEGIDCAVKQKSTTDDLNCPGKIHLTDVQLTGIDFLKPEEQRLTCDDIPSIFHQIYLAVIIIAPILVIILGSMDFGKAVIASDESKMQSFKKKFPVRLVALVLLILVPLIIKFLLGTVSGLSTTLLDCIVNGNPNPTEEQNKSTKGNGTSTSGTTSNGSSGGWSKISDALDSITNKTVQKASTGGNSKWSEISKDINDVNNQIQSNSTDTTKTIKNIEDIKKKVENNPGATEEDKKFTEQVKRELNSILDQVKKQASVEFKK